MIICMPVPSGMAGEEQADAGDARALVPGGTDADQRKNRRKRYADSHDQRDDPPV